jgi:hypothetical protein
MVVRVVLTQRFNHVTWTIMDKYISRPVTAWADECKAQVTCMSQLIIETDTIKKASLYFFAIVGIAVIVGTMAMGVMTHYSQQAQPVIVAATIPAPATTPMPTVVQTPAYPTVIEFTVLSTTVAGGHYQVITTTGSILYMPDFASWNALWPQNTYVATITGTESNGALDVGTVNLISVPSNYPVYFHWNLNYYAYDGHTVNPTSWKETIGHKVIEGQPPIFYHK